MDLTIKIVTQGDDSGLLKIDKGLEKSIEGAKELGQTLKLGLGIDIGGRLVESVAEIPRVLQEATMEGVKFNQFLQDSSIAVAGAMRSADPTKYADFKGAQTAATDAISQIQERANALGLDFHSMVESFSINLPTLAHAGITQLKDQIDTITLLLSVARQKGIDGFQAQRDIIDLLNGQGERTILGKELNANGVTTQAIESAKQMGTLADLFRTNLAGFSEGMQAAASTFSADIQRFYNEIDQVLGKATLPIFTELQSGVRELNAELANPGTANALKALGYDIAGLVQDGVALTEWAVKNADSIAIVAHQAAIFGVALAAIKVKDLVVGMLAMAGGLDTNASSLARETAQLERNTAATAANNTEKKAGGLWGRGSAGATLGGIGAAAGMGIAIGDIVTQAISAYIDHLNQDTSDKASLGKEMSDIGDKRESQFRNISSPQERDDLFTSLQKDVTDLTARRNTVDAEDAKIIDNTVLALDAMIDATINLSDSKLKQLETEKKITEEKERQKQLDAQGVANAAALADDDAKRKDRASLDGLRDLAGKGDVGAVDAAIASRQKQYDAARQDFTHPAAVTADPKNKDQHHSAEEINQMAEDLAALQKLRASAVQSGKDDAKQKQDEADKEAIASMQDQKDLVEALGKERIAQLEAAGGTEAEIGSARKQVEDEVAAQRLQLENKIGAIQKESDDEKKARLADYATDALARQNTLDKTARDEKQKLAEEAWASSGAAGGKIDARSQREYDAGGRLASDKGILQPGFSRDRMGTLTGPGTFDQMTGPGWGGQALRTPADLASLMPPAQRPGSASNPATAAGAGGRGSEGGAQDTVKAVQSLQKSIDAGFETITKAINALPSAISKLSQTTVAGIDAVSKAIEAMGTAFKSALKDLKDKVDRISRV